MLSCYCLEIELESRIYLGCGKLFFMDRSPALSHVYSALNGFWPPAIKKKKSCFMHCTNLRRTVSHSLAHGSVQDAEPMSWAKPVEEES